MTDYKAIYGEEPAWDLQREKQRRVGENYRERVERKKRERGQV